MQGGQLMSAASTLGQQLTLSNVELGMLQDCGVQLIGQSDTTLVYLKKEIP